VAPHEPEALGRSRDRKGAVAKPRFSKNANHQQDFRQSRAQALFGRIMIALVWILLQLASNQVDLVDEVYRIPPGEWRSIEIGLKQRSAVVSAEYEARAGSNEVRLALMERQDLESMRDRRPHALLAATAPGASGRLRYRVRRAGDYAIVVDNRRDRAHAAEVRVRVWVDFAPRVAPTVTQLTPRRQLTVILVSFACFFAVATYSARRLLRAVKR